ncbi:MAG: cupin domain-containing protein [Rhodocyclaceae bacterium]|nr:cupin domain-containing protein [Rhodocyclaceae bacterium]
MKTLLAATATVTALGATPTLAETAAPASIVVTRNGEQASLKGPDDWFTGPVRVDMLFRPEAPARTSAGLVTFEPGSRTAWHAHPLGQNLIVTSGKGWVQAWGGPKREIQPGDVVWIPPGVKHWHGATATTGMMHIAVQESLDGSNATWMEKVSDTQYAD